jgi:hypothetical protein
MADGARRRQAAAHNENVWLAWHVAAFTRQRRLVANDMRQLMIRPRRQGRQTWQDQMSIFRAIAIAHGGAVHD